MVKMYQVSRFTEFRELIQAHKLGSDLLNQLNDH